MLEVGSLPACPVDPGGGEAEVQVYQQVALAATRADRVRTGFSVDDESAAGSVGRLFEQKTAASASQQRNWTWHSAVTGGAQGKAPRPPTTFVRQRPHHALLAGKPAAVSGGWDSHLHRQESVCVPRRV